MTEQPDTPALTSEQVIDRCGITYRQLDHWVRKGYLVPRGGSLKANPGSGIYRSFTDEELTVAARMARLVNRGFTPYAAARIARTGTAVVRLGQDLTLVFTDETAQENA